MQPAEQQTTPQPQDCGPAAQPQKEHEWLHQIVGDWKGEGEAVMGPDQPAVKWTSTETVRSLGGLWVIAEGKGEMPGGGVSQSVMTLGFDPRTGRYAGTFVGSMMTHLWVYDGVRDEGGTVLTLNTEGPAMTPDAPLAKYKDVIEIKSADERTLTSLIQGADGEWTQFMTATYRRAS